jgi:hypothetical protein
MSTPPSVSPPQTRIRTVVVEGPLALRMHRLAAARSADVGLQILTLPQLAARLAGGFARPAVRPDLAPAIQAALAEGGLVDLEPLRTLPGMVRALSRTLDRLWLAGVDPAAHLDTPRLADLALIDGRTRARLGPAVLAPPDLRAAAERRIGLANRLLGEVVLDHVHTLPPVWGGLLESLAREVPVAWTGAPKPAGAAGTAATTASPSGAAPESVICADPSGEVVEALRWARSLIASGQAVPEEIALVAAAPEPWDDAMLALARAADLPIHASHGVPILATVEGQACAALAELLSQGLTQDRVRRLLAHSAGRSRDLQDLPPTPLAGLPAAATLGDLAQWRTALALARARRDDEADPASILMPALELLTRGLPAAEEAGARLLPRPAAKVWAAALQAGPPEALSFALEALRVPDDRDPGRAVVWGPAAHLMGAPRPWVRMLGLTARAWPRPAATDPLLPDHILALDPTVAPSRPDLDRRAFAAIAAGAAKGLILSYARRSAEGGLQAPSPLVPSGLTATPLRALRTPAHAYSDSDRLRARPQDALATPRVARAQACWRARRNSAVTPYDGALRPDHPAVIRALEAPQSATSLRQMIRDPLGYLWRYGLGWRDTVAVPTPLSLDDRTFGDLVHLLLQRAVSSLEPLPGFGRATEPEVAAALGAVTADVLESWPLERPTPPPLLWRYTLDRAGEMALAALTLDEAFVSGTRSWTELRFGDPEAPAPEIASPWDPGETVRFPGTRLAIRGVIDRLELDTGDSRARLTDYKTGAPPPHPDRVILAGGRELQRVLYAAAVRHHRPDARTQARLVYLRETPATPRRLSGDALEAAMTSAAQILNAGEALIRRGVTLPGPDSIETWNPYRLALPAIGEPYYRLKRAALSTAFGPFDRVWRAP